MAGLAGNQGKMGVCSYSERNEGKSNLTIGLAEGDSCAKTADKQAKSGDSLRRNENWCEYRASIPL
jgi:hypothetical protein